MSKLPKYKIAILGLFLFVIPFSTSASTKYLEDTVYTTPGGVKVIRLPKGWEVDGTPLTDKKPEAYVFFNSPDKTVGLQVGVGAPMPESENPLAQADELISRYTGNDTLNGKKISGKLVSKKVVNLGNASGYYVEIKRTDLSGKWRVVQWVVATSGPDYYYSVASKVPEKKWNKYKKVIEASSKTIQIIQ
jgi:hypothetical protein